MDLQTYFDQPLTGTLNRQGSETDWLDFCELEISRTLGFGDPFYFPHYHVQFDVLTGLYQVQVKVRDFGVERRIAALRVVMPNREILGKIQVKSIPVDSASITVSDYPRLKSTIDHLNTTLPNFHQHFLSLFTGDFGVLSFGDAAVPLAYVGTGWGDGIYEVDKLISPDSSPIGGEIIFIEADPYLMEDVEPFEIINRETKP